MKFVRIISLLLIGATLYQSCSSSFNPDATYKNIPVVYGLLSITDTVHYIKIEKAFLTKSGNNAYTDAQIADSLYYPQETLSAVLEAYNNGSQVGSNIPLTYADGVTLGLNKDTGVFAINPNIVYYTKATLNPNYSYKLVINNTKTGEITSAQTNMVDTFLVTAPYKGQAQPINFSPLHYFNTYWENSTNAALYQLVIRFHYREMTATDSTDKVLTWTFPVQTSTGNNTPQNTSFSGRSFYTFVADLIPVNPAIKRRALSFDFWYYAGGQEFYTFQQVSIANSTSLVQGQINPTYTNISNGIGLYSSIVFEPLNGFGVGGVTSDSLACEPVTRALNFYNEFGELCGQ